MEKSKTVRECLRTLKIVFSKFPLWFFLLKTINLGKKSRINQYRRARLSLEIMGSISEMLSELVEPVVNNMNGVEISSTEEALYRINNINKKIMNGQDIKQMNKLEEVCDPYYKSLMGDDFDSNDLALIDDLVELGLTGSVIL